MPLTGVILNKIFKVNQTNLNFKQILIIVF
jgi:hypothetical protein